jgi:sensor histidine kinase regulating citrate/malate metabolism
MLRREVNKRTAEIKSINSALVERNEYIKNENIYKEQILNSGYNGIVTIDCKGSIQFVNSYARSFVMDEEIPGKCYSDTLLKHFFNDSILEQLLKDKSKIKSGEVLIDGRYFEYVLCALYSEENIEKAIRALKEFGEDNKSSSDNSGDSWGSSGEDLNSAEGSDDEW